MSRMMAHEDLSFNSAGEAQAEQGDEGLPTKLGKPKPLETVDAIQLRNQLNFCLVRKSLKPIAEMVLMSKYEIDIDDMAAINAMTEDQVKEAVGMIKAYAGTRTSSILTDFISESLVVAIEKAGPTFGLDLDGYTLCCTEDPEFNAVIDEIALDTMTSVYIEPIPRAGLLLVKMAYTVNRANKGNKATREKMKQLDREAEVRNAALKTSLEQASEALNNQFKANVNPPKRKRSDETKSRKLKKPRTEKASSDEDESYDSEDLSEMEV